MIFGIADYTYLGLPRDRLYLADQHEWFVIALVLLKPWCIVGNPITSLGALGGGTEFIGVFYIVLTGMDNASGRCDAKSPSLVFVQQRTEHIGIFDRRPAKPIDIAVFAHMGDIGTVSNYSTIINMFLSCHWCHLWII